MPLLLRPIEPDYRHAAAALVLAFAAGPAAAQDPQADGPDGASLPDRPRVGFFNREREDWRVLERRGYENPLDELKYMPLDQDANISLSVGGAIRFRYEYFSNFGLRPQNDDGYLLSHIRLHADLRFGDAFRVFAEGKSAWITERDLPGGVNGIRAIDEDQLDLQQLWASYTFDASDDVSVELRGGRLQLTFGAQRLISPLPWANTLRSWDGGLANITVGDWSASAFWTAFAPVQRTQFNTTDADIQLWGVYASGPVNDVFNADLYFLGFTNDNGATFNGTTGDDDRKTVGARLFRPRGRGAFDFDLEGAYQFGDVGPGDVSAFFIDGEAGWTFTDSALKPRIGVGGGYASGDDAAGGDVETFNPLFPLGHAYHGYADQIGRQNVIELRANAELKPTPKLKLRGAFHAFWRAETNDAVYNAGGVAIRPGSASDERYLGIELDFTATYVLSPNTVAEIGYSRFFAGSFFKDAGGEDDLDFLYAQLILKF